MKKILFVKKISLVVVCVMVSVFLFVGCGDASKDTFVKKSETLDTTGITGICIDVRDREIAVVPSADDQIHLAYYESSQEFYAVSVSDEGVLTMTSESDKDWLDYIGTKPASEFRKIGLQLPDDCLQSLELSTTNEDISCSPLTVAQDVTLSNNGGSILFDEISVGKSVTLFAKNGNITGTLAGAQNCYTISCNVKKGESNLPVEQAGGAKALTVECNNGDVAVQFGGIE